MYVCEPVKVNMMGYIIIFNIKTYPCIIDFAEGIVTYRAEKNDTLEWAITVTSYKLNTHHLTVPYNDVGKSLQQ